MAAALSSTTKATTFTMRKASGTRVIRRIHDDSPDGLIGQLDFSATPRYQKGGLFTWTVYDYPLKQAIIDGVVKRPMKGITAGLDEAGRTSPASSTRDISRRASSAGGSIGTSSSRSERSRCCSSCSTAPPKPTMSVTTCG